MTASFEFWLPAFLSPRVGLVLLSAELWSEAALLAAARLRSNDGRRSEHRDRQQENAHVDLMGAASEILLYRMLERFYAECGPQEGDGGLDYMRAHLFVQEGGGSAADVDLRLTKGNDSIAIDAKSFDFSPNKRMFAINENKHQRLMGLAPLYFCMLCPALATKALIALVPYAEVDQWESRTLGTREPPDPAKVQKIDAFCNKHFGSPKSTCEQLVAAKHDIMRVRSGASQYGAGMQRIRQSAPSVAALLGVDASVLDATLSRVIPAQIN